METTEIGKQHNEVVDVQDNKELLQMKKDQAFQKVKEMHESDDVQTEESKKKGKLVTEVITDEVTLNTQEAQKYMETNKLHTNTENDGTQNEEKKEEKTTEQLENAQGIQNITEKKSFETSNVNVEQTNEEHLNLKNETAMEENKEDGEQKDVQSTHETNNETTITPQIETPRLNDTKEEIKEETKQQNTKQNESELTEDQLFAVSFAVALQNKEIAFIQQQSQNNENVGKEDIINIANPNKKDNEDNQPKQQEDAIQLQTQQKENVAVNTTVVPTQTNFTQNRNVIGQLFQRKQDVKNEEETLIMPPNHDEKEDNIMKCPSRKNVPLPKGRKRMTKNNKQIGVIEDKDEYNKYNNKDEDTKQTTTPQSDEKPKEEKNEQPEVDVKVNDEISQQETVLKEIQEAEHLEVEQKQKDVVEEKIQNEITKEEQIETVTIGTTKIDEITNNTSNETTITPQIETPRLNDTKEEIKEETKQQNTKQNESELTEDQLFAVSFAVALQNKEIAFIQQQSQNNENVRLQDGQKELQTLNDYTLTQETTKSQHPPIQNCVTDETTLKESTEKTKCELTDDQMFAVAFTIALQKEGTLLILQKDIKHANKDEQVFDVEKEHICFDEETKQTKEKTVIESVAQEDVKQKEIEKIVEINKAEIKPKIEEQKKEITSNAKMNSDKEVLNKEEDVAIKKNGKLILNAIQSVADLKKEEQIPQQQNSEQDKENEVEEKHKEIIKPNNKVHNDEIDRKVIPTEQEIPPAASKHQLEMSQQIEPTKQPTTKINEHELTETKSVEVIKPSQNEVHHKLESVDFGNGVVMTYDPDTLEQHLNEGRYEYYMENGNQKMLEENPWVKEMTRISIFGTQQEKEEAYEKYSQELFKYIFGDTDVSTLNLPKITNKTPQLDIIQMIRNAGRNDIADRYLEIYNITQKVFN
ncbi:hypothetical protein EIN_341490 [Entamoeba invadens IP1]|uniref:Uncharacterized protein n=1 Tax=Entamoeba invadens IP1 TaxID=370355 RepID=A0A0A1UH61_ENTIV|nr:hypothetical protein EIN_341490 [Entamoeba invadens IP1]ELP94761.1 hypothetical protein EIN_341490 [Entamoeba invadens IP1]|eukprot:XP_004261532.1 hypothetical protein EIN_341490 [Entamoeba invadens IP1]